MRCSRRETSASKLCVLAASLVGVWASAVKGRTSLKDLGHGNSGRNGAANRISGRGRVDASRISAASREAARRLAAQSPAGCRGYSYERVSRMQRKEIESKTTSNSINYEG
jgi:hypothetical protein